MLCKVLDKWPDVLEVYKDDPDDLGEKPTLKFVVMRRNSRSLQNDQLTLLRMLEEVGLNVVVRIGLTDLTIEQFEKGGIWQAKPANISEGTQGHYNARSELKRLEEALARVDHSDSRYLTFARRITHLRQMLSTVEPEVNEIDLRKSDEALKRLEAILNQTPEVKTIDQITDEELAAMDWDQLAKLGVAKNTSAWDMMVHRRAAYQEQRRQEKTQNAQQSTVTNPNHNDVEAQQESGDGTIPPTPNES
jgi:hypothetical protein